MFSVKSVFSLHPHRHESVNYQIPAPPPKAKFITQPSYQFMMPFVFQFQHLIFFGKFWVSDLGKFIGRQIKMENFLNGTIKTRGNPTEILNAYSCLARFNSLVGADGDVGKFSSLKLGKATKFTNGNDVFVDLCHWLKRIRFGDRLLYKYNVFLLKMPILSCGTPILSFF